MSETPSAIIRGRTAGNDRTELYKLLYANLPMYRMISTNKSGETRKILDVHLIAEDIGVSYQKVSKWLKDNGLPGSRVQALINLKESSLTFSDLGPFINSR